VEGSAERTFCSAQCTGRMALVSSRIDGFYVEEVAKVSPQILSDFRLAA
jgi:hypothetical protein